MKSLIQLFVILSVWAAEAFAQAPAPLAPPSGRAGLPLHWSVMIAVDPDVPASVSGTDVPNAASIANAMRKSLKADVEAKLSVDLTDAMRASRTVEHDVLIALPQVMASAVSHGYALLTRSPVKAQFVLMAKPDIRMISDLTGRRLYLLAQDSESTYLAKGLLKEANFHLKSLKDLISKLLKNKNERTIE